MLEVLYDHTFLTVLIGVGLIGLNGGVVSVYLILRKQSLIGDLVSHATLPGIVIFFLIFGIKQITYFSISAILSGLLSILFVILFIQYSKTKSDTAIAINLSSFFGIGILLLSYLQKSGDENQSGVRSFLFGQASALTQHDVLVISIFTVIILLLTFLFWKELKILSFDAPYYLSLGYSMLKADLIIMSAVVIMVTLSIQAIGVTLMAAMVIAPAAAAKQWTNHLFIMMLLSICFGITSSILGTIASTTIPNLPTGPTVVLFLSFFVMISIFFAPKKGIIARYIAHYHNSKNIKLEYILIDLVALAQQHKNPYYAHTKKVLETMTHKQYIKTKYLKRLENIGWVAKSQNEKWSVTQKGYERFDEIKHKYFINIS